MGRMTPGRERSMRSRASAACSAPDSIAAWRSSIFASTCARNSLSCWPTARLSSAEAGFSQLSVIRVSAPDFLPSHASRNVFQVASSFAAAASPSNRARTSAKSSVIFSGRVILSCASVCSVCWPQSACSKPEFAGRGAACCAPTEEIAGETTALKRKSATSRLSLHCGFSLRRELRKGVRVAHGQIGQNLAVERDARRFQSAQELAVGQPVLPRGGADALDPQAPILPLFRAAVAKSIPLGAIGRFLRGLIELALGQEKAFCAQEQ